jgi:hypothetical protein
MSFVFRPRSWFNTSANTSPAHPRCRDVLICVCALDASEGEIKVGLGNGVGVILDGYRACLKEGGVPFIPADFWKKMDALPPSRANVPADARRGSCRSETFTCLPFSQAAFGG